MLSIITAVSTQYDIIQYDFVLCLYDVNVRLEHNLFSDTQLGTDDILYITVVICKLIKLGKKRIIKHVLLMDDQ